jgi:hypothetical protein
MISPASFLPTMVGYGPCDQALPGVAINKSSARGFQIIAQGSAVFCFLALDREVVAAFRQCCCVLWLQAPVKSLAHCKRLIPDKAMPSAIAHVILPLRSFRWRLKRCLHYKYTLRAFKRAALKICRRKLVGSLSLPLVCFYCRVLDQCSIKIKSFKQASFIARHVGLQAFERIFAYEERPFHCAVMSPESDGAPGCIKDAASIGEIEHESPDLPSVSTRDPTFSQTISIPYPLRIVSRHVERLEVLFDGNQGLLARRVSPANLLRLGRSRVLKLKHFEHCQTPFRSDA